MNAKSNEGGGSQEKPSQSVYIRNIYLKDLSFESPRAAEQMYKIDERPEVTLSLEVDTRHAEDVDYEVLLGLTVTARTAESKETLYLIEVKQAGLFTMKGFDDEQLDMMLHVYCANILFPYARETISAMVERGGFPQLLLNPVNFDAVYKRHLEKRAVNISEAEADG